MLVTNNEVKGEKLRAQTIQRLAANVFIKNSSGSIIPNHDFSKINLKCILHRDKKQYVIFQDNLDILARESMYFSGYEFVHNPNVGIPVENAGGTLWLYPLMIDLGMPINLKGSDEITFEVNTQSGWMGTNQVTPSECKIDFQWRDAIGVEEAIPQIKCRYIPANENNFSEAIGDNILSLALVNTNSNTYYNFAVPVLTMSITSDRYNINETYNRMVTRRTTQFDTAQAALARYQTFRYQPDTEIDDCRINLTLQGSNVVQGKNALVWRTVVLDEATAVRAQTLHLKHESRDAQKVSETFQKNGNRNQ